LPALFKADGGLLDARGLPQSVGHSGRLMHDEEKSQRRAQPVIDPVLFGETVLSHSFRKKRGKDGAPKFYY
jgi:hypothetical protein